MLKCLLIGNLGSDPDMKYTANGTGRLTFNVASNGRVKNQQNEWVDQTTWVRVTVLGNRAETLSQHLRKGLRVYVDGRLEARPWTDNQGQIRAGLEILADSVEFMSPRQDDDERPAARPSVTNERRGAGYGNPRGQDDDLDDIPF